MSTGSIDFVPEARREIDDAFEWYLERSAQAAEAFLRELDRAFALIVSAPQIWAHFEAGARRYVLRKFPYDIVYREIPAGIQVVAVAHHKKRPRYWRGRLFRGDRT